MKDSSARFQILPDDQIKLHLLGFLRFSPDWSGRPHKHGFWELLYVYRGRAVLHCRHVEYLLEPGQMVLVRPFAVHRMTADGSVACSLLYIGFSFSFHPNRPLRTDLKGPVVRADPPDFPGTRLKYISRVLCNEKTPHPLGQRGMTFQVVWDVVRAMTKEASEAGCFSRTDRLVERVKDYLRENAHRAVSLEELTDTFHLAGHYLGDLFKKTTGVSIKRYHHILRMELAARRLIHTTRSVSEIADELNFGSVHYFSRRFKEYYDMPPQAFRMQHTTDHQEGERWVKRLK